MENDFAVQQNELLCRKRFCSTAKRIAVQETILQYSKTNCCAGNDFAVQQNELLHRKRFCWTAKRIAVQETVLLDSKTNCCAGNGFAGQQSELLREDWLQLRGEEVRLADNLWRRSRSKPKSNLSFAS